jgi:glycosyltransferase involved in cell wall biosynthesis
MLGWEFPPFISGGLGTYLYYFTDALSKIGVDVTLIVPGRVIKGTSSYEWSVLDKHLTMVRVESTLRPYVASITVGADKEACSEAAVSIEASFGMLADVIAYTNRVVKLASKLEFDVIHCHDWMCFPAGIILKQLTGKPLIVTMHATEYDRTGQLCPNPVIREIEKKGMMHADLVVTVSVFEKQQLVEKYEIPARKIRVIYSGIDLNAYKRKKVREKKGKIVLFVGRLTIQKGCEFFLEAASEVLRVAPDTKFLIVGTGDMMPQLIDKAIDLGIMDHVYFLGFQEDVQQYYSLADVFVMPSVSEPFGLACLEAMACKAPVIISKQSGASEVLKHCFKVDFWDTRELANKILGLLHYKELNHELRVRGYRELQRYRGWKEVAEDYLNIYKEVC